MTPPLAATGRIEVLYTVGGLVHKAHAFVRNPQLVGTDWKINSRLLDENDTLWSDAAQTYVDALTRCGISTESVGQVTLQKMIGGVWVAQAAMTPTFSASGNAYVPGSQITLTLRDKLFYRFKVQFMERAEVVPQLVKSATGGDAAMDNLVALFGSATTYPNPFHWIVSMHNQFLVDSPFVSCSVKFNRKLLRARGLA